MVFVQNSAFSNSKAQSYITEVIAASPSVDQTVPWPVFPQLQTAPRVLPLRVAAMFKILVSLFGLVTIFKSFLFLIYSCHGIISPA